MKTLPLARVGAWVAFAAIIWLYFVFPLRAGLSVGMIGTGLFAYDAVLNAGILEWVRQALGSSSRHIFEWTAGYPLTNTLANTENLLGWQPAYALLRAMGVSVTFAYNAMILASFFISAVGAQLLARRLGANEAGAFLAGLIFAFTPFHIVHVIHLQTMAVCWVPFALLFLDRYLVDGRVIDLIGVAVSSAVCALAGAYIGIFLAMTLPLYLVLALATRRAAFNRTRLLMLVGGGLVTAVLMWPVASHYLAYSSANGYKHPLDVLTRFSIELLALIKVPTWLALWASIGYPLRTAHEAAAFPGVVATGLFFSALIVAVVAWRRTPTPSLTIDAPTPKEAARSKRAAKAIDVPTIALPSTDASSEAVPSGAIAVLLVLALVFLAFALGPRLMFQENTPIDALAWMPMPGRLFEKFSAVRWPMRAYFVSLLCGAVIAGIGFTLLTRKLSASWRTVTLVALSVFIVVEYRPIDSIIAQSVVVPDPMALSGAYAFLASETDQGGVVELPAANRTGYRTPMMVLSTYGSAGHLRRVVAIHGSALPPLTVQLLEAAEALPSPQSIDLLRRNGVSRVVLHRRWVGGRGADDKAAELVKAGLPVLWRSDEAMVFSLGSGT